MSRPVTGRTKVAAVIGHPVAHSLSPAMHNAAFEALGMDYRYVPFDVKPEQLPEALEGMRALGIVGMNVTIPHKPAACRLVDSLAPSAQAVEAVNTIHLQDGLLVGYSTDGEGFARSLEAAGVSLAGQEVVLLGAGGAARSVAAACLERGVSRLTLLNRTFSKAVELAVRLRERNIPGSAAIAWGTLEAAEKSLRSARVVVQCTSVGMHPNETAPPPIPAEWLRPGMVVYDLIYNPEETRLLAEARSIGAQAINGLEMLVYQGAVAFEIWTGVSPPLDIMREALRAALRP